ncbi:MAG: DUF4214 domain-containing protein [Ruthenibacterium sp.]
MKKFLSVFLTGCFMLTLCAPFSFAQETVTVQTADGEVTIYEEFYEGETGMDPEMALPEVYNADAITGNGAFTLVYDINLIKSIGRQKPLMCSAYALAYCRAILDGKANNPDIYWKNGVGAMWNWGNYKKIFSTTTRQDTLRRAYDEITSGKPVILHVNGNGSRLYYAADGRYTNGHHYVALMAYKTTADPNNLSESDFYGYDPANVESWTWDVNLRDGCLTDAALQNGPIVIATDNPPPPPTAADPSEIEAFVRRLYETVLGRGAEPAGLANHSSMLATGQTDGAKIAGAFVFSQEYLEKNTSNLAYLTMLYAAFFDREPDENGLKTWTQSLENGLSREYVFQNFISSSEYAGMCKKIGISLGSFVSTQPRDQNAQVTAFIERLYETCLDRKGEQDGLNQWANQLLSHTMNPREAAHGFIFSPEFLAKKYSDADYVKQLYRAFMGREFDENGLLTWTNALADGTMNREAVYWGFANSMEFAGIVKGFGL